jgi:hypothetical protein
MAGAPPARDTDIPQLILGAQTLFKYGGDERIRTADLLSAIPILDVLARAAQVEKR